MSLGEKRVTLFNQWETARNEENWRLCELCMRDLLDTLDKESKIYSFLLEMYNTRLWTRDRTTIELNNAYVTTRRLTDKILINQRQEENLRRFWIDLKSDFYDFFRKNSLLPVEK